MIIFTIVGISLKSSDIIALKIFSVITKIENHFFDFVKIDILLSNFSSLYAKVYLFQFESTVNCVSFLFLIKFAISSKTHCVTGTSHNFSGLSLSSYSFSL